MNTLKELIAGPDYKDNMQKIIRTIYEFAFMTYAGTQGCISCGTCSYPKLTEDHVLTSAYVKIFRTVTRNAVNKGV